MRKMIGEFGLEGRTVIVTGAGQGIGEAVVDAAIGAGARVLAADINGEALEKLASRVPAERIAFAQGDISDEAFAAAMVEEGVRRFGAVHGLVNNAGISRPAMIEKMTADQWRKVVDVNLTGSFLCMQAVGRHLIARARDGDKVPGAIVNIASEAGRRGSIGQVNYACTKAAIFAMTMSAAREWAKYGIRVNSLSPGGIVETPMTETIRGEKFIDKYLDNVPMGRTGTAREIALPICFLLSAAASYITGQTIAPNGGFHMQIG
jgi:3-oxoacyl-[acyl-carrier protein] reductase